VRPILAGVLALLVFLPASTADTAPTPAAVATLSPSDPLTVEFDASTSSPDSGRALVEFRWDFGDGATAVGPRASHRFALGGPHGVMLTIVDDSGVSAATMLSVLLQPEVVSLASNAKRIVWGKRLSLSGTVAPNPVGGTVVLEQETAHGWRPLASVLANASGGFSAVVAPTRSAAVRARVATTGSTSPPLAIDVAPLVRLRSSLGLAFGRARIVATIRPRTYSGRIAATVRRGDEIVGRTAGRVTRGKAELAVPTPGLGLFGVSLELRAQSGLGEHAVWTRVRARASTLQIGFRGPEVRALASRLTQLRFHLPRSATQYAPDLSDAVIAFQKSAGLPRTGIVSTRVWRALAGARPPAPRYRTPGRHIEVDKRRQILMVVRAGRITGVLPASTGATGNTPEGSFRILWKAPTTTTWLGPAILYRTLTFHAGFAIHGFDPVPAYPASHGCVRVPIWAADWLYNQSPVGERIFIY
jgi:hypothetical protein